VGSLFGKFKDHAIAKTENYEPDSIPNLLPTINQSFKLEHKVKKNPILKSSSI
jgi:hypothetical protein